MLVDPLDSIHMQTLRLLLDCLINMRAGVMLSLSL